MGSRRDIRSRREGRVTRSTARTWLIATSFAAFVAGCAVQEQDLTRWETTLGGPKRLSAVVLFDKYPLNLRVEAAMSLVRMKPRKGRHEGLDRLVKGTLVCDPEYLDDASEPCKKKQLSPEVRAQILADFIPKLIEELKKEPPKPTQGGQAPPDPSFKFKDAGFLMLSYDKTQVITDPALRKQLEDALIEWAMKDFERRLNDQTQAFGMEQLLRHIGPPAVRGLPALMERDTRNLAKISDLISKIGSKETKEEASTRLVEIATYVASDAWKKEHESELKEANRKAGFDPPDNLFQEQLTAYQDEAVTRVYQSMKQVGGEAVVDYCLKVAATEGVDPKRRQTSLAALEGHIDRKNEKHIKALLGIATAEKTPDEVVDQAFRRIREMPRDAIIKDLYSLMAGKDWKRRRLAAVTILKMSTAQHIPEFLGHLGEEATKNFNLAEALTYGAYLGELPEGDPLKALLPYMSEGKVPARIAALAYYYSFGDKTQVDAVKKYEQDAAKIAKCEEDGGCDWTCVVKEGEAKKEQKITTVGEFVSHCIKPHMLETEPKKKDAKDSKKSPDKDDKKEGE
jgi:hypothetical protein